MKILVGYEGTGTAEGVLADLRRAGLPEKAQVCVLVAIPPLLPAESLAMDPTGTGWLAMGYAGVENDKMAEDAAVEAGRKATRFLNAHMPGWTVTVETRPDFPDRALLEKADVWKPDLIAVGSHGWSWLGRAYLGSTAEKILTHARTNVRLCHPRAAWGGEPPRLLIAVDGSRDSRLAVAAMGERSWPKGTRMKLLAVKETKAWTGALAAAVVGAGHANPDATGSWKWMEGYLEGSIMRLSSQGVQAESSIQPGDPRHIILTEAAEFKADCIVMGRRGISGFERLLLGSVSGAVASHAACSVEIVRKTGNE
ncbi:MAG: universal stress protein [Fibrobacteria bacterium]